MKPRGRPKKDRVVKGCPRVAQFSPRGKPGRPDETELNMDQFEAIRLTSVAGLSQKEAAVSMNISQPTFSRILKKAHKAMGEALIQGRIIRINSPAKSP